jgi:isoquinoline 1-oxidoreductase subunit alpha
MARYQLTINGVPANVDAAGDMPLLWVLRDTLGLTGTKFGCGAGHCGACTVHLEGAAVQSCNLPLSRAAGKQVVTIEGLNQGLAHPLQQAWMQERVPQCGYCQSGQIMAAAALLAKTPRPNTEQIDAAMRGNLCRCGTYQRIRRAIQRAAAEAGEP